MADLLVARSKRDTPSHQSAEPATAPPDVSVVIPCLNEADTLEACIDKAERALRDTGLSGEIIVADNGSTDASRAIARRRGVRLINVSVRGYGAALDAGISAAQSELVIMGDADDSYDFGEVPRFGAKLREGYDLVQGCRRPSGGGRILPGPCRSCTAGSATHRSRRWCGACSRQKSPTCIAACADSARRSTPASINAASAWSSRPRW